MGSFLILTPSFEGVFVVFGRTPDFYCQLLSKVQLDFNIGLPQATINRD